MTTEILTSNFFPSTIAFPQEPEIIRISWFLDWRLIIEGVASFSPSRKRYEPEAGNFNFHVSIDLPLTAADSNADLWLSDT
jgi:hypothetical protein